MPWEPGVSGQQPVLRLVLMEVVVVVVDVPGSADGVLMGRFASEIEAITRRDYLTLQGVVLFIGATFVVVNLLVDALYSVLDPRLSARHG